MNKKIRILHIDDNIHDRLLVKDALLKEHNEFDVTDADNREKFEKYLAEQEFDIVLSDFNILGFDGLQVLQVVKEKNPGLPVIIVTGTGSEEIAIQAMKMGAADYVIKSVKHIQGLVPTIHGVLKNKRAQEEQKKAEDALKESEANFRYLFENSPVGKSMTGIDGNLHVNKSFSDILGYSEGELSMKKWPEITHPDDINISNSIVQSLLNGEIPSSRFEKRYIHKNGNIVWADVATYMKRDISGKPQFFITTIADITERKKVEDAIRNERILLRTLINNLPDTIYVKDKEGRKLVANSADLLAMGSISESEIIGKTDLEIFNNEAGVCGYNEDMSVLKSGQPLINHEECFFNNQGKQCWRITSKIPLFNEEGTIIGLVGFGRDITERKKSEELLLIAKEKAEESDRLKTAFLHNISHEIRTPMNAIVGFTSFLSDPALAPEKREHFTEIIIESCNQLLSIITDIVNIATIEAGQITKYEKAINVNNTLKTVFELFSLSAQKKNIAFQYKTSLPDSEAIITTDNTKLVEVLSNLISNSLKFTKEGYIIFGYERKENFLEFFIEDTGIGIPRDMHNEIFKRFRQVEITSTRQFGGSGLGLSISKAYIELLGGKIWVDSETGKGSVFYFTIPYQETGTCGLIDKQPADVIKPEAKQLITILIAEDEDSNYLLIDEILLGTEFKIIRALNGLEAVEICKSKPNIDLVLMDIKMPIMDGYEATKQIKQLRPDLPVIAQTAYSNEIDKNKAIACGCSDFISKPFKRAILIVKIKEHLKNKIL